MKQKELTDQELLEEAKKMKSNNIVNAIFIGAMIGIVIYSIVKNSLGFLTLILLYFLYKAFNNSDRNKELEHLLKERNLK